MKGTFIRAQVLILQKLERCMTRMTSTNQLSPYSGEEACDTLHTVLPPVFKFSVRTRLNSSCLSNAPSFPWNGVLVLARENGLNRIWL